MKTALLLGALFATSAGAEESLKQFATLNEAARAALSDARAFAPGYESGGTIYQCGSVYAYLPPVSQHKKNGVKFNTFSGGKCSLAGVYHNHPEGPTAHRFSDTDMEYACALGVPSFLAPGNDAPRVFNCEKVRDAVSRGSTSLVWDGRALT